MANDKRITGTKRPAGIIDDDFAPVDAYERGKRDGAVEAINRIIERLSAMRDRIAGG